MTSFDEDGVRLSDSTVLPWYTIDRAKVADDQQAAFDKMRDELADDLFRIRQRLRVGDYEGLLPHAEAVYSRYADRKSETAYMVLQSLMWGRIASGQREAALTPYLLCYRLLRKRGTTRIEIAGERRLVFNPKTAVTAELTPIWFDVEAAKRALPDVYKTIRAMNPRPDGVYIYFATLAVAAGDDEAAGRVLKAIRADDAGIAELYGIIEAQREVTSQQVGPAIRRLQLSLGKMTSDNKPLALYWVGRSKLLAPDIDAQQQGLLDLLRIPALYGDRRTELASAALYHAMQHLAANEQVRSSVALRGELLAEYGNTYFARLLNQPKAESQP